MIEVYGEEKQMLEFKAAPNKEKYWSTFTEPGLVADAVSGFLREEAQRDIQFQFQFFIIAHYL